MKTCKPVFAFAFLAISTLVSAWTYPVECVDVEPGRFVREGSDVVVRMFATPQFTGEETFELKEITYRTLENDSLITVPSPLVLKQVSVSDSGLYLIQYRWNPVAPYAVVELYVFDDLMERFFDVRRKDLSWKGATGMGWLWAGYSTWPWLYSDRKGWVYATGDDDVVHFYSDLDEAWYSTVPGWLPWVWARGRGEWTQF